MTRWGSRLGLLAILAGTAALRLRLLAVPLDRDEGEYAYMGQLILRGETPYLAAHNMKLPGVYYAYAGIIGLLGETDVAIRLGLLAITLASLTLLYLIGRRLLDATAGLTAAAAYAVLSLGQAVDGFTANAEHFVVAAHAGRRAAADAAGPTNAGAHRGRRRPARRRRGDEAARRSLRRVRRLVGAGYRPAHRWLETHGARVPGVRRRRARALRRRVPRHVASRGRAPSSGSGRSRTRASMRA